MPLPQVQCEGKVSNMEGVPLHRERTSSCGGHGGSSQDDFVLGLTLPQRHCPPPKKETPSSSYTQTLRGSALCSLRAQDPGWPGVLRGGAGPADPVSPRPRDRAEREPPTHPPHLVEEGRLQPEAIGIFAAASRSGRIAALLLYG